MLNGELIRRDGAVRMPPRSGGASPRAPNGGW